jgi:folate-binding protein YgfZ
MPLPTLDAIALLDRSDRVRVRVAGPDRAKCLHNLTTNDVKRLAAGAGCEAFVTSPQGKTLAHVVLAARPDDLLVLADAPAREGLLGHLGKYAIFDDVQVEDLSGATFELHLVGPRLDALLPRLGLAWPGEVALATGEAIAVAAGLPVTLLRDDPLGRPGLTVIGPRAGLPALRAAIEAAGAELGLVAPDAATAEVLRIAAGTPAFGRDVTPENLPQEVGRDRRAISFVKGCYLGQETVARIDAIGHVNRHLRSLRLDGPLPPPGTPLVAGGKPVGTITSAAALPDEPGVAIALGYVRTAHADAGSTLAYEVDAQDGRATVADIPGGPG